MKRFTIIIAIFSVLALSCSNNTGEKNSSQSNQADSSASAQPGVNGGNSDAGGDSTLNENGKQRIKGDSTSTNTVPGNDTSSRIMNTGPDNREKKAKPDSTSGTRPR